ncbi:MAG: enoyl-CoA hydratase [Acidobacteria bacterium]|nr:enoyl-CoA hydratase [Acidobacteriota bacterium]
MSDYETILTETRGRVGLITLHRPEALNALNLPLIDELVAAATDFDVDPGIGAIVITGSERAFAVGADIKQMSEQGYMDVYLADFFSAADRLAAVRTPLIAAVSGYALGGGCELAMVCDILIASETAKFGQPEINLGVIPGIGGSQRLTRAVGKALAMDLVLTGRTMDAAEALRAGLAARVVPVEQLMTEAMSVAETIAAKSLPVAMLAKEAVNQAYETTLSSGLRFERRIFHSLFATNDQKEGMRAFIEKRAADFTNS